MPLCGMALDAPDGMGWHPAMHTLAVMPPHGSMPYPGLASVQHNWFCAAEHRAVPAPPCRSHHGNRSRLPVLHPSESRAVLR